MVPKQIEREVAIDAPVERVWALLTEAEHIGVWFGDAGAEIDLRPGGTMDVRWSEHGSSKARIERVEPTSFFSYRWAPFRDPGGAEPGEGNSTLVEFTLTPDGAGTRLRVVESGFDRLACSPEQQAENAEGNTRGWIAELDELVAYAQAAGRVTGSR